MFKRVLLTFLLALSIASLAACDLAEELLQQFTGMLSVSENDAADNEIEQENEDVANVTEEIDESNDENEEGEAETNQESEAEPRPSEQEPYPEMTVEERIEAENITVFDTPNGFPIEVPMDWYLVEDADYDNEAAPLEFKYCFDSDMLETIHTMEEYLASIPIDDYEAFINGSPQMNTQATFSFITDPEYSPAHIEMTFYIDEFGSFVGNNCVNLSYSFVD